MAFGFRRTRHGIEVKLSRPESLLLRRLAEDLATLLDSDRLPDPDRPPADPLEALVGMTLVEVPRPTDPVLARLLPDGYTDDDAAAADFRRYTEPELRAAKRAALLGIVSAVRPDGGRIVLDDDRANAWLPAINDLRLALGTRLDVGEDVYEQIDQLAADDPRLPHFAAYEWLGGLEDSLVRALAGW